jgi:hypothetical protein
MPASGAIPFKFPPFPDKTPALDKSTQSGLSKQVIDWVTEVVKRLSIQIAQIIGLSFQNFTQETLPHLTQSDAGALIHVTDFNHVLQWTGNGWEWGPGDSGGGFIQAFLTAPAVAGWHICDGSTVKMLNGDGTTSSVTLPDYTTAAYLKLGKILAAGPNAASGQTDPTDVGAPTGVVSAPTFIGTPGVTGIESADLANVSTSGSSTAAAQGHTHNFTPQGTVTAPTFIGNDPGPHTHGPGNLDLENTTLLAYFRQ